VTCRYSNARPGRRRNAPGGGAKLWPLGATDVASDVRLERLPIEPPETKAPPAWAGSPPVGEELERLVLEHHGARGFEPARAVQSRARYDHVKEQRFLVGALGMNARTPVSRTRSRAQRCGPEEREDSSGLFE